MSETEIALLEALVFVERIVTADPRAAGRLERTLGPPSALQGESTDLLRWDFGQLVVWWFLGALHPAGVAGRLRYPQYYAAARDHLARRFPAAPGTDVSRVAQRLARLLEDASRPGERLAPSPPHKLELLGASGRRCAACGFAFPDSAVERFMGGTGVDLPRYPLYDFWKRTRRSAFDFQIEADHVHPVARGGASDPGNYQLLCGFCNRCKRDYLTVFDASVKQVPLEHPKLGRLRISSWFLVYRTLRGSSCAFCGATATDRELTVAPIVLSREINPVNVRVTCYECDPFGEHRYVQTAEG